MTDQPKDFLTNLSEQERELIAGLASDRVASRLFDADPSLWGETAALEAASRLGWVDAPLNAGPLLTEIAEERHLLQRRGIDRFVLCGMGGSSLAPAVIAQAENLPLTVLDSTHPTTVRRVLDSDLSRTAVIVSSKSGSTVETRSHLDAFTQRFVKLGINPSERLIVVTDPDSPLEKDARRAGMRVFLADPNVGGRFSALTAFGLVPSGLAGGDVSRLVSDAAKALQMLRVDSQDNPALALAVVLKPSPSNYVAYLDEVEDSHGLGSWIEQLLAESTGKDGNGVLPALFRPGPITKGRLRIPNGRAFALEVRDGDVKLSGADVEGHTVSGSLGAHFMLWEAATAVLCRLIGANPFDQPDVESAKAAARAALENSTSTPQAGSSVTAISEAELLCAPTNEITDITDLLRQLRNAIPEHGYLSLQAYLDQAPKVQHRFEALCDALMEAWDVPVTLGWGPRYLHSTGQFHKGGPKIGAYLQILDFHATDTELLTSGSSFAHLIESQAAGDRDVLSQAGRPVVALRVADPEGFARELMDALAH